MFYWIKLHACAKCPLVLHLQQVNIYGKYKVLKLPRIKMTHLCRQVVSSCWFKHTKWNKSVLKQIYMLISPYHHEAIWALCISTYACMYYRGSMSKLTLPPDLGVHKCRVGVWYCALAHDAAIKASHISNGGVRDENLDTSVIKTRILCMNCVHNYC